MPQDFLQLSDKTILVCGVANRKSVAWHVAKALSDADCRVVYSVRSTKRREEITRLLGDDRDILVCDMEEQQQIDQLAADIRDRYGKLDGLLHSLAFADYQEGMKPFHQTPRKAMLRAFDISCYSLIALSNALREILDENGSVVTVSISTTTMASENYGYMAPIKAALDSSLAFLAKSFSQFSRVRFNAVAPGLLKTSASAGIPGYVDSYLYAEQATLRRQAVQTDEVAAAAAFLLSPRSSGMNAQHLILDAGMSVNYFDERLVRAAVERG